MKEINSYGKIFQLGNPGTENALVGEVIVQEKIDGSQFGFGLNEDREITIRSKGKIITHQPDEMFREGWEYVMSQAEVINNFPTDTYLRGEYLKSIKHNTLKYDRIPKNHIILFDGMVEGKFMSRQELLEAAEILDLEVVPELYHGEIARRSEAIDFIKNLIANSVSCLGGEFGIEGIVIKNYAQNIMVGGQVMPLFTKYVQERFKEKNSTEWATKKPKGQLQEFIDGFCSVGRFEKSFQHLRDNGSLEYRLQDIPKLVSEIQRDIIEEEKELIMNHLYKCYVDDIKRTAVRGVAEWYKEKLLENVK